jgi:dihydroneopterin triphosphate diphosphatase
LPRAPFQVLVIPFHRDESGSLQYAILRRCRQTGGYWQFIAGGGETDEEPLDAARREAAEEGSIDPSAAFISLESMAMIPVVKVAGFLWGKDKLVIPERCFGVEVKDSRLTLSDEHEEYQWVTYQTALNLLQWDSNKNALWELDFRLKQMAHEMEGRESN